MPLPLLALATCLAGCANPVTEESKLPVSPPVLLVSAPINCATLQFTIVNTTKATVTFPASNCGTGLRIIKSGAVTWSGTTRLLTLNIRVRNTSGLTVNRPIRVALPDTGRFITAPAGQPGTKITATSPDSLYSNTTAVWFAGTVGTLANGDSTAVKQVKLTIATPVTAGQAKFTVTTNEVIGGMPTLAPNIRPAWFDQDSSVVGGVIKRVLSVDFVPGATVAQKQAAVDSVMGSVVGGAPWINQPSEGVYFIYLPNAATGPSLDAAVVVLKRQPSVSDARVMLRGKRSGRRPDDGTGWKAADWTFNPDSASGRNWAFEELNTTLAWGCEVGRSQTSIGIVDQTFKTGNFKANVVGAIPTTLGDTIGLPHGSIIASLIAAKGNDSTGMAGINWVSGLRLKSLGPTFDFGKIADAIDSLMQSGVSVINISLTAQYALTDSAQAKSGGGALLARVVNKYPLSARPLFVISAGNDNRDAVLAASTTLRDYFPAEVIVVGGAMARVGTTHDRWPGASFVSGEDMGSNWGSRIDVYAPGKYVPVWNDATAAFDSVTGTSYSAALVTGIAGLLKSFNSTLTSAQIKTLILAGADSGRRTMINDPSKYLANAYESLKLAATSPGTPICGNVIFTDVSGAVDSLTVKRGATQETIYAGDYVGNLSVAQGGRLIGFESAHPGGSPAYQIQTLVFANGTWQLGSTRPYSRVQYLEFDTAYTGTGAGDWSPLIIKRANGTTTSPIDLTYGTGVPYGQADVSWNGYWVAIQADFTQAYGVAGNAMSLNVDSVGRNQRFTIFTHPTVCQWNGTGCADQLAFGVVPAVWSHDDKAVTFLDNRRDMQTPYGFRNALIRVTLPNTVAAPVLTQNRFNGGGYLLANDAVFTTDEFIGPYTALPCHTVTRNPVSFVVVNDVTGDPACGSFTLGSSAPNAPPATGAPSLRNGIAGSIVWQRRSRTGN